MWCLLNSDYFSYRSEDYSGYSKFLKNLKGSGKSNRLFSFDPENASGTYPNR